MQILVHHDNHIHGSERLSQQIEDTVRDALSLYEGQITRVEVHVQDVNAQKGGDRDKHCTMEARFSGHQPIAVHCESSGLDAAVAGAAEKLEHAIRHLVDKLGNRKGLTPAGGEPAL
jgi:ribosome-associated translation inhibitor RaiA